MATLFDMTYLLVYRILVYITRKPLKIENIFVMIIKGLMLLVMFLFGKRDCVKVGNTENPL